MTKNPLVSVRVSLLVNRILQYLRYFELRRAGASIQSNVQTYGRFFAGNPNALVLGRGVRIMRSSSLHAFGPSRSLQIENSVYINRNVVIDSRHAVTIGRGTIIAPNVYIADFDHGLIVPQGGNRADHGATGPITIEENVWIGANASILKGVTIGARSVIGAGSVVTRDIPADVIAAGNPARVLRELIPSSRDAKLSGQ